jgi:hypothetical protein
MTPMMILDIGRNIHQHQPVDQHANQYRITVPKSYPSSEQLVLPITTEG